MAKLRRSDLFFRKKAQRWLVKNTKPQAKWVVYVVRSDTVAGISERSLKSIILLILLLILFLGSGGGV